METIYFTKYFLSGNLKGLSVICKVSFATVKQCADFAVLGRKGKDVITNSKWVITDRSFQNYQR